MNELSGSGSGSQLVNENSGETRKRVHEFLSPGLWGAFLALSVSVSLSVC